MADTPRDPDLDDGGIGRLLRERLPRHPAPATLRAAVVEALEPRPARRWAWPTGWLAPVSTALATAMVMLLWLPTLDTPRSLDPLRGLARAMVTEHERTLSWAEEEPEAVQTALPDVIDQSGITLNSVFKGDDELQMTSAQPTYVEGHRGLSLGYVDAEGHALTYVIVPGSQIALPDGGRQLIDRWRAVVRTDKDSGFTVIMWKQQGQLCALVAALVSDDDVDTLKDYFVRVREATDLKPI
jgi:hypothetical protein